MGHHKADGGQPSAPVATQDTLSKKLDEMLRNLTREGHGFEGTKDMSTLRRGLQLKALQSDKSEGRSWTPLLGYVILA